MVTPFDENEEIAFSMLKKQVVRLADAGMGIVLLGTNGEGTPTQSCPHTDIADVFDSSFSFS